MIRKILIRLVKRTYTAAGTLETVQENIISTRNAIVQTKPTKQEKSRLEN